MTVKYNFGVKAGRAFVATSFDRNVSNYLLQGNLSHLIELLGKNNVDRLAHRGSGKPYGDEPVLAISEIDNTWTMTPYGSTRYQKFLELARV